MFLCLISKQASMRNRWVEFATAPDQTLAESWSELVRREGCPCTTKSDSVPFLGVSMSPVRLVTIAGREDEARSILDRYLSTNH